MNYKFGDSILVIVGGGTRARMGKLPDKLIVGSFLKMMNETTIAYYVIEDDEKVVRYCNPNNVVDQTK